MARELGGSVQTSRSRYIQTSRSRYIQTSRSRYPIRDERAGSPATGSSSSSSRRPLAAAAPICHALLAAGPRLPYRHPGKLSWLFAVVSRRRDARVSWVWLRGIADRVTVFVSLKQQQLQLQDFPSPTVLVGHLIWFTYQLFTRSVF